jgi:hypothetical protein
MINDGVTPSNRNPAIAATVAVTTQRLTLQIHLPATMTLVENDLFLGHRRVSIVRLVGARRLNVRLVLHATVPERDLMNRKPIPRVTPP